MKLFFRSPSEEYIRRRSISQEDFFARQLQWLYKVGDQLLIEGYDAPFMRRDSTVEALRRLVSPPRTVHISAIMPEGLETVLDELKTSGLVSLTRTPEEQKRGYMVFDGWGFSEWDSTKSTPYEPERNTGVIYRRLGKVELFDYSFKTERQMHQYMQRFGVNEARLREAKK